MIRNTVLESTRIQMAVLIKDSGPTESNMVKVFSLLLKVPSAKESGMKVRGLNGSMKTRRVNNRKTNKWTTSNNEGDEFFSYLSTKFYF